MFTPLFDALQFYSQKIRFRLHMPGHKGRLCGDDVTELPGLDNLHAPDGCIATAQALLAQAYGANRSFFLVNGSSAGILAYMLSLGENKRVLVERGAHSSFANAIALAGHDVHFLPQRLHRGIPLPSVPEDVEKMLKTQRFDAVCVVSPNYYGLCAPASIGDVCRRYGVPLFVDEAHGAHFIAGAPFPYSASTFASVWVQSAHKTLAALTQGAFLHVGERAKDVAERIAKALTMVQTTSPSYPIMRSLDDARAAFSAQAWRETARVCGAFIERANGIDGVFCLGATLGGFYRDPTRVVVDVSGRCSGFLAAERLFELGIAVEAADFRRVVLIVTPYDAAGWGDAVLAALVGLPWVGDVDLDCVDEMEIIAALPRRVMSVRAAVLGEHESVLLEDARGRVAAAAFGLFPPCVPLVWPGEQITESVVQCLRGAAARAGTFGIEGGRVVCVAEG